MATGENLGRLRRRRRLTQEQLAEASDVAVSTIRKLEQGTRYTVRVATLNALASGLRVPLSALLSTPADTLRDGEPPALAPIRRALTPPPTATHDTDADLVELRHSAAAAWDLYQRGDYETLAALLPDLVTDCEAAAYAEGPDGYATLADVYHVTASFLMALTSEDLAYVATQRLMAAGDAAGDPMIRAVGEDTRAWIFSRHGRFDDAEQTAISAAEAIEPSFTRGSHADISTWLGLILRAVMVTSRNDKRDETTDLLNIAASGAQRVGRRNDRWTVASPSNVAMHRVRAAMELGDPERALDLAEKVRSSQVPPVWRARHLIDIAQAQIVLRRDGDAVETLERIEEMVPGWLRYQGLAETIVRELLGRERRSRTPTLRDLATRLDIRE